MQPIILGYSREWNRRIEKTLGDKLKRAERYHLPYSGFRSVVIEKILAGKDGDCKEIEAVDFDELQDSLGWEHHLHHYKNRDDFLTHGNGFVIQQDGRIVSGASSFVTSTRHAECQVTTVASERRRGFARRVSAAHLDKCLRRGLKTPWDAANEASVKLAQSLGFTEVMEYDIYQAF